MVIVSLIFSYALFGNLWAAGAVISGLAVGLFIGMITEVYTSADYKSVKEIGSQSETGAATTIISGMAVGMKSTAAPVLLICVGIFTAYQCCGLTALRWQQSECFLQRQLPWQLMRTDRLRIMQVVFGNVRAG